MSSYRNLMVGGLPLELSDTDFRGLFEKFGKVESAKVMLNVETCESRGYGFVLFDSEEAGCRAFGERNKQIVTIGSKTFQLDIKPSEWDGKHGAAETTAIYVRNIPGDVSDESLKNFFHQFGEIVSVASRAQAPSGDPQALPKKQSMIEFTTVAAARVAIENSHRKFIFAASQIPVLAKFADLPERQKRRPKVTSSPPSFPAPQQVSHTTQAPASVRFPDARPLPLAPRPGFQRIFYQGILGITPDGILYPIQPELCHYLSASAAATPSIGLTPPPVWLNAGGPFLVASPPQLKPAYQFYSQTMGNEGVFFLQAIERVET
jgi:RNA recognition motif-containing protein